MCININFWLDHLTCNLKNLTIFSIPKFISIHSESAEFHTLICIFVQKPRSLIAILLKSYYLLSALQRNKELICIFWRLPMHCILVMFTKYLLTVPTWKASIYLKKLLTTTKHKRNDKIRKARLILVWLWNPHLVILLQIFIYWNGFSNCWVYIDRIRTHFIGWVKSIWLNWTYRLCRYIHQNSHSSIRLFVHLPLNRSIEPPDDRFHKNRYTFLSTRYRIRLNEFHFN